MGIWCSRSALTISAAAAILYGCAAAQSSVPDGAVSSQMHRGSQPWMLPDARQKDLLYVSDGDLVYVFDYETHQQVGTLTGFTESYGQCVDAKGDVWITDIGAGKVFEYAHGGTTPISTLTANSFGDPIGCSVSRSGDLAVALTKSVDLTHAHPQSYPVAGGILVFANGSGNPKSYQSQYCQDPHPPGYDPNGNLYFMAVKPFDQSGYYWEAEPCELPAGRSSLRVVALTRAKGDVPEGLGSVQWDGKHIVFTRPAGRSTLLRTSESANGDLKVVGVTRLRDSDCNTWGCWANYQVFLVGKKNTPVNDSEATAALTTLECGCEGVTYFSAWQYPNGGSQSWSSDLQFGSGVSVSLAH
jgi:hypothetical protein